VLAGGGQSLLAPSAFGKVKWREHSERVTEESRTETNQEAELADVLQALVRLLSAARPCDHHATEPDRALRLDEAAPLLAMSHDFVYRNWKRLGGYKDTDHHIKFRTSDNQRHLQRKAKEGRP
jgi:hypothetical protein